MADFSTTENQRVIIVVKEIADKDHLYSVINLEASDKALSTLKGNEFKFWYYIAKNQNNYRFALSAVDCCRKLGISRKTYNTIANTLIDQGYLVPQDEGSNVYIFYENPKDNTTQTSDDKEIIIPDQKVQQSKTFKF